MIISQTALRLSLFGGNTDFREYFMKHEGLVLTATIDKYVYCIIKERFDDLIIVNYSSKETVTDANEIQHELVREALRLLKIEKGIEISFLSDIPSQGSGLGSSSTVVVGLLNALHSYLGESVSSWQLAEEAVKIEVDILKKPIGIQDQYAVALGGLRHISFKKNGKVKTKRVEITDSIREDFNNSLMLFYTGVTRKTDDVLASFDPIEQERNLDTKKAHAVVAGKHLTGGRLGAFGDLLDISWMMKKRANSKTTTNEIDSMYETAVDAGMIGGKIMGAGGGGFLLAMFKAHRRAKIREALKDYKEMPFRFNNFGSRVILNI